MIRSVETRAIKGAPENINYNIFIASNPARIFHDFSRSIKCIDLFLLFANPLRLHRSIKRIHRAMVGIKKTQKSVKVHKAVEQITASSYPGERRRMISNAFQPLNQ
jgi:hypothetical protein